LQAGINLKRTSWHSKKTKEDEARISRRKDQRKKIANKSAVRRSIRKEKDINLSKFARRET